MKNEKDVQVVHALPGRVRIKLHRLKNNMPYAAEIQRDLRKVSGMKQVATNPQTGSLLLEYDPHVLEVLVLHSSVSSCLGPRLSDGNKPKTPTPAKGRVQTPKIRRKSKTKQTGKAKPKKSSRKPKKN